MTRVDVTSTEMWFSIIPPSPFYQFISPLSASLTAFLSVSLYHSYLAPHFSLMYFFMYFSFSLWSQCKTSAGTPQSVTLLVWPWVCPSVEMTPNLAGPHFTLYFLSQFQPYLATQPRCFSSLSISSCKGQPQRLRVRRINRYRTEYSSKEGWKRTQRIQRRRWGNNRCIVYYYSYPASVYLQPGLQKMTPVGSWRCWHLSHRLFFSTSF